MTDTPKKTDSELAALIPDEVKERLAFRLNFMFTMQMCGRDDSAQEQLDKLQAMLKVEA